nr:neuronatin isoform X1 [Vicugna pacos]
MAAVAAASAELLIIGWYIFRVLLQCRGRHRTPLPVPCALLLALDPSQCARPGTKSSGAAGASRGRSPRLLATKVVFLECCIYWVGFAFRNPPGTQPIARSEVFRYSLQKLAYTVSRTGRHVLGERRHRAPN